MGIGTSASSDDGVDCSSAVGEALSFSRSKTCFDSRGAFRKLELLQDIPALTMAMQSPEYRSLAGSFW